MLATKSSKASRISKRKRAAPAARTGYASAALALILFALIGAAASAWIYAEGYTLYYGDAEAHLNIARRVVDGRTPGYDQIGTVWLPLPHVLLLPFAADDSLWMSGLAGAIPGVPCFAFAAWFLFLAARRAFDSTAAGMCAGLLFALNPNLLYLQSAPMTEPVFFLAVCALLYVLVRFQQTQSFWLVPAAGIASGAASLTRYEGWFLIPFVAAFFLFASNERRVASAVIFGHIASIAPLYWLAHNWWYYGNALEFYNGPYSPWAIYERALKAGMGRYPGDHDWTDAARYFLAAARLSIGWPLAAIAALGCLAALLRRAWWPLAFLTLSPVFYVLSLYSSSVPIFVPQLWPNSYYNTRYGLAILPLAAFAGAAITGFGSLRIRKILAPILVAAAVAPWIAYPRPASWICWKESEANSIGRRAWTAEVASFLRENYKPGDGIIMPFGDLTGILRAAGIPIREALHEGNNPHWDAVLARPDLFLWEEWAIAISADPVSTLLQRAWKDGPRYRCVRIVSSKDAPVIEIYRRDRQPPLRHDYSVHQSSRGEE